MSDEIAWMSATELAPRLAAGELSATEVATAMIDRIEKVDPTIHAFVHLDPQQILNDAKALDDKQASGAPLAPLHGVPYSIKCLTDVEGLPATGAMTPFKDQVAEKDAVVVARMKAADGLFLGLTNAPEGGYYGGTDSHLHGPTHNPWAHGMTAGGSSGGAAAAVASGLGPLAEGADGAGSVRIPAAMCGVVGYKPSLGTIPHTLLPSRSTTNVFHGPLTRTVGDAALMLEQVAGFDPRDMFSLPTPAPGYFTEQLGLDIKGWKVAYSSDLGLGHVDPEVDAIVREALGAFADLGATVVEAVPEWDDLEKAMWEACWVPLYATEYDLADWPAWKGQLDDNLLEIFAQAEKQTVAQFGVAEAKRGLNYDLFTSFMSEYDLLVSPTLTDAAFPLTQFAPDWLEGASLQRQLLGWLLTYPYDMFNNPAITLPAGFTSDGRPVGIQLAGRHRADAEVLRAAANFERARPWHAARPPLGA
ncbi:amidase family protein [Nocardioides sp. GY 10127]|uniref:amidase n=1 Tax=Nocardioides sp. GY 10127 TaxID=2569762 RepID=UPI0010A75E1A|nr:amidase family protein [Nocardioides sp. GY 10127]TIC82767.1 amidase [Nocardioides sp. GY 10127]